MSKTWDGIKTNLLVLREITVFKTEIALLALAPRAFPVKVDVYTLLVLLGDCLGLRVSLEPCQVFNMEPP
jgi:hypothetical protein